MGFWSKLFRRSAARGGTVSLADPGWLTEARQTLSGVSVTPDSAMRAIAVYACVRLLAETIATLPLHLLRKTAGGDKEHAKDHPLYSLLHDGPNALMTAAQAFDSMMAALVLRGNAYAIIVRGFAGEVLEIIPLHPDRVRVEASKSGRELVYIVDGRTRYLSGAIWHVRGFSLDGVMGVSPITYAREAIGLALVAERHGAAVFGNAARPGGVLRYPGKLDDEAYDRLKQSWHDAHSGDKTGSTAVLEEGAEWQALTMSLEDAQYIDTRKFQRNEIASLFRVPPHMIGDLERATFSNIEQQSIEFVTYSIRPWLVRIEQSITRDLLLPSERQIYIPRFNAEGLLRGDFKSRMEGFAIAKVNGIFNSDEIRDLEDRGPIPNGAGQVYLQPLNMTAVGSAPASDGGSNASSAA